MQLACKKQRVLVVDDHPKVLRIFEIYLQLHGFDVITATSGDEALEKVRLERPDIMFLDIVMPGTDGFEVLKKLRAFSRLPVIAVSASQDNQQEALRLGANDFVPKPFLPSEMVKKIEYFLPCIPQNSSN